MRNFLPLTCLLLTALALASWSIARYAAPISAPVAAQADKIFEFDRTHPHRLPAHLLRSLSLALAFCDEEGAHKLIRILEKGGAPETAPN